MDRNDPIGIFDSGVGGLTVAREICRLLPNENILYAGDTARVPYGSRKPEEIVFFMHQILRFLQKRQVKLAVIACNTITAYGYCQADGVYPFSIVPMNNAVKEAVRLSPHKRIGVIATEATIRTQMHYKAAMEIDADIRVYQKACPRFVPLIEGGVLNGLQLETVAQQELCFFKDIAPDSLILGCTHYPLITDVIQKAIGTDIKLVNPAKATADDVARLLKEQDLLNHSSHGGSLQVCFSAQSAKARQMVGLTLNTDKAVFEQVDFAAY